MCALSPLARGDEGDGGGDEDREGARADAGRRADLGGGTRAPSVFPRRIDHLLASISDHALWGALGHSLQGLARLCFRDLSGTLSRFGHIVRGARAVRLAVCPRWRRTVVRIRHGHGATGEPGVTGPSSAQGHRPGSRALSFRAPGC